MVQHHLMARRSQAMAVAVSARPPVFGGALEPSPHPAMSANSPEPASGPADSPILPLIEVERKAIIHALEYTKGDRAVAANLLGIGRTTLYRKLKEYQLAC
jgi:transcriptional regulator of acetoin/glycerol metabolism